MKILPFLLALSCPSVFAAPLTVFTNGKIVTVDATFSITDAMALDGARIVALGDKAKALATEHGDAKRVDLGGRMVLPGLMDSHAHPVGAATYEFDHPVPDIGDIPQLLDYVATRAKALPEGALIGVSQVFITRLKEQRYPTREELDRVAPRHPVQFSTGPDSMLNSLALQLAGIDRNFKVPAGSTGVVVFDEKGEPTGLMHAFSPKINAKAISKKPDATQTRELVRKLFADYNSVGFTTIADRGASQGNIDVYQALRDANALTVRLRLSHTFSTGSVWRTTELALEEIIHHPLTKPDPMLQIIGTKIWLDGGMLTGSALMLEPWGEFVSTKTFFQADARRAPHQFLPASWEPLWGIEDERPLALGCFADSMVPLHGYRFAADLRAVNEFWLRSKKDGDSSLWLAFHPDLADPKSSDPIARESTRLWCAAVTGAQTTLDPKQMKEWTPNSKYGGHAFGFKGDPAAKLSQFDEFLAKRDTILPWIAEYSPYALVTSDDPPIYMTYGTPPALGQEQKDPTHTSNFGVKLQEHCKANGVACELFYPGAPDVKHASVQDFLIEKLKAGR